MWAFQRVWKSHKQISNTSFCLSLSSYTHTPVARWGGGREGCVQPACLRYWRTRSGEGGRDQRCSWMHGAAALASFAGSTWIAPPPETGHILLSLTAHDTVSHHASPPYYQLLMHFNQPWDNFKIVWDNNNHCLFSFSARYSGLCLKTLPVSDSLETLNLLL